MKQYILGNWKMFKTKNEIQSFCHEFNNLWNHDANLSNLPIIVGIAPTYVGLSIFQTLNKTTTNVIAQNANANISGAFTSEVSFNMLKDLDVNMVLIGHSEVRSHLHETDTIINKKNQVLLEQNMTPILCIGETLNEFESGQTINVLQKQLELALQNINPSKITQLIIAYEPVWAIGTGKTATAELIQKTFHEIKKILQNLVKENVDKIPLLYGGSVNEKNAAEILRIQHVNGVLVGGASLDPQKFYDIIRSSPNYQKFTQGQ